MSHLLGFSVLSIVARSFVLRILYPTYPRDTVDCVIIIASLRRAKTLGESAGGTMASTLSKAYPTAVEETTVQEKLYLSDGSISSRDGRNSVPIAKEMERKIIMKTDLHVLPILFLLFLVSFVDRTNIGNAKIEGLTTGLHMVGDQYSIAVFVFNIPYVLLDIPSNLLLRRVRPNVMLGTMMFCWGKSSLHLCVRPQTDSNQVSRHSAKASHSPTAVSSSAAR